MRRRLPPPQRLPARLKLGASILEARRAAGLTQESLGQRLGLKGRAIYRWERNETAPSGRHRSALIREIHLFNPQAGIKLQDSISKLTGKAYAVVPSQGEGHTTLQIVDESKSTSSPLLLSPIQQRSALDTSQSASDVLALAILKMADELDLSPRRLRRALSVLLEQLQTEHFTLETLHSQLEICFTLLR